MFASQVVAKLRVVKFGCFDLKAVHDVPLLVLRVHSLDSIIRYVAGRVPAASAAASSCTCLQRMLVLQQLALTQDRLLLQSSRQ
jgi:hypothetical protein